jgi:hypothetical protein
LACSGLAKALYGEPGAKGRVDAVAFVRVLEK